MQIVDICLATRPHNGGLINLEELCRLLNQRRKSAREAVTEDDCLRAISKLKVLFLKICDVYYNIPWVHTTHSYTTNIHCHIIVCDMGSGRAGPTFGLPKPDPKLSCQLIKS